MDIPIINFFSAEISNYYYIYRYIFHLFCIFKGFLLFKFKLEIKFILILFIQNFMKQFKIIFMKIDHKWVHSEHNFNY
jgi:hypothetical protein